MAQTGERIRRLQGPWAKCPPSAPDDPRVEQLLKLYPEHDARRWVQQLVAWQRRADSWERYARELEAQGAREVERTPPRIVAAAGAGSETHALAAFVGQELERWGFGVAQAHPHVLHVEADGKLFTICTFVRVPETQGAREDGEPDGR